MGCTQSREAAVKDGKGRRGAAPTFTGVAVDGSTADAVNDSFDGYAAPSVTEVNRNSHSRRAAAAQPRRESAHSPKKDRNSASARLQRDERQEMGAMASGDDEQEAAIRLQPTLNASNPAKGHHRLINPNNPNLRDSFAAAPPNYSVERTDTDGTEAGAGTRRAAMRPDRIRLAEVSGGPDTDLTARKHNGQLAKRRSPIACGSVVTSPLRHEGTSSFAYGSPSSYYQPPATALTAGSVSPSCYFMYAESSVAEIKAPREGAGTATDLLDDGADSHTSDEDAEEMDAEELSAPPTTQSSTLSIHKGDDQTAVPLVIALTAGKDQCVGECKSGDNEVKSNDGGVFVSFPSGLLPPAVGPRVPRVVSGISDPHSPNTNSGACAINSQFVSVDDVSTNNYNNNTTNSYNNNSHNNYISQKRRGTGSYIAAVPRPMGSNGVARLDEQSLALYNALQEKVSGDYGYAHSPAVAPPRSEADATDILEEQLQKAMAERLSEQHLSYYKRDRQSNGADRADPLSDADSTRCDATTTHALTHTHTMGVSGCFTHIGTVASHSKCPHTTNTNNTVVANHGQTNCTFSHTDGCDQTILNADGQSNHSLGSHDRHGFKEPSTAGPLSDSCVRGLGGNDPLLHRRSRCDNHSSSAMGVSQPGHLPHSGGQTDNCSQCCAGSQRCSPRPIMGSRMNALYATNNTNNHGKAAEQHLAVTTPAGEGAGSSAFPTAANGGYFLSIDQPAPFMSRSRHASVRDWLVHVTVDASANGALGGSDEAVRDSSSAVVSRTMVIEPSTAVAENSLKVIASVREAPTTIGSTPPPRSMSLSREGYGMSSACSPASGPTPGVFPTATAGSEAVR